MRSKFDKVKEALELKTINTPNYSTLIKHPTKRCGKYSIQNLITNSVSDVSYDVLDDIIVKYKLDV